jgi:cell division protein ZapA (FtsZ GTPase activity inhibitor)
MGRNHVNIDILGTSFSVATDEDTDTMNRIIGAYRKKVEDTAARAGSGDPLKIAIITGLLLTDQLMKSESCVSMNEGGAADDLTERMIRSISDAVKTK